MTVLALLASACASTSDEEPAPAFGGILEPDVSVPATPEVAGVDTSAGDGTAVVSWATHSDGGSPVCAAEVEVVDTADDINPIRKLFGNCVTDIGAGIHHSCALLEGGSVECWGHNGGGQLGREGDAGPVPGQVVGLDGVEKVATAITAGSHSCALLEGGSVECWGGNNVAQLGREGDGGPVPGQVVGLDGEEKVATAITAGSHSCALLEGGSVECWG
ncbi:MAG: hypothetical protein V1249_08275, partial [Acidimicrobiales bacterium]|nr:hypothetical protein [Acidimicrobiales bacterium]